MFLFIILFIVFLLFLDFSFCFLFTLSSWFVYFIAVLKETLKGFNTFFWSRLFFLNAFDLNSYSNFVFSWDLSGFDLLVIIFSLFNSVPFLNKRLFFIMFSFFSFSFGLRIISSFLFNTLFFFKLSKIISSNSLMTASPISFFAFESRNEFIILFLIINNLLIIKSIFCFTNFSLFFWIKIFFSFISTKNLLFKVYIIFSGALASIVKAYNPFSSMNSSFKITSGLYISVILICWIEL